jgi:hypothetical protein
MKKTPLIWVLVIMFLVVARSIAWEVNVTPLDNLIYQVGRCESGNNQNVRPGDNGMAHGRFQFHTKTFNWLKGKAGMPELNIKSERDQEILTRWAFQNGYSSHWTCYHKVKTYNTLWRQNHRVKYLAKVHKPSKHITLLLKDNPEKASDNLMILAKSNPETRDVLKVSFLL